MILPQHPHIAIIGLGYVGLPLAIAFGRLLPTLGLDTNTQRVQNLREGCDASGEASAEELASATHLRLSHAAEDLRVCNVFIITVPTPVDDARRPDLEPLRMASETVGRALKPGDVLHSPDNPDQSCGMVMTAAPSPAGGYEALAVVQSNYSENVRLGSLDGPVVKAVAVNP